MDTSFCDSHFRPSPAEVASSRAYLAAGVSHRYTRRLAFERENDHRYKGKTRRQKRKQQRSNKEGPLQYHLLVFVFYDREKFSHFDPVSIDSLASASGMT